MTDRPLDLQALGERAGVLLRELGEDSLDALAERLARTTSEVAALVEKALG
ncbi:hypothetical protein [Rhodobacter capsulatus]|uniref:hypothetical protein n=1 Tax=Rhodobacter capsulatus TaxID=1061 RepID=UPI004027ACF4